MATDHVATASGVAGIAATYGTIAASATLSPLLYKGYASLNSADKHEWHSKFGHIVASITITALSAAALTTGFYNDPVSPASEASVLMATSPLSAVTFGYCLGYFFADICNMISCGSVNEMLVHHIGGAIALFATLFSGQCHFYGLLLLSTEMTTPFICLRWLLDKTGRRRSQLYALNGACILIGWILGRLLLLVYVFVHMWDHRDVLLTFAPYVQVIAPGTAAVLCALNMYWFERICRGAVKLLLGRGSAKVN